MAEMLVKIRGIDPLLFRDGRPFTNEEGALHARSLPLPLPGTLAGFLRSQVGQRLGWHWNNGGPAMARAIPVAGPIPMIGDSVAIPAPADAVAYKPEGDASPAIMPLRPVPLESGAGCDLPPGLQPLGVTGDAKPESGYQFWKADALMKWLLNATGEGAPVPEKIGGLETEERVHVGIRPETGTSDEGMLFTVQYRAFAGRSPEGARESWSLLARILTDAVSDLSGPGCLGGERRLAVVESSDRAAWPGCPPSLRVALAGARRVRMVLATPGLFEGGWKPGWLGQHLRGSPPGGSDVRLRLVSAAVPRRQPVSGWDYERGGPKVVRWMAPAGSVYFFEVESGSAAALADRLWLEPVSDGEQDRRDGYGLALWGLW